MNNWPTGDQPFLSRRMLPAASRVLLDEVLWSRLIFAIGAVVTAATIALVLQGHFTWLGREPFDEG